MALQKQQLLQIIEAQMVVIQKYRQLLLTCTCDLHADEDPVEISPQTVQDLSKDTAENFAELSMNKVARKDKVARNADHKEERRACDAVATRACDKAAGDKVNERGWMQTNRLGCSTSKRMETRTSSSKKNEDTGIKLETFKRSKLGSSGKKRKLDTCTSRKLDFEASGNDRRRQGNSRKHHLESTRSATSSSSNRRSIQGGKNENGSRIVGKSGSRVDGKGVNYVEVIRNKDERARLDGFDCADCERYYDSLNGVLDKNKMIQKCSRHRARYKPYQTPDGFWNLSFQDSGNGEI